MDEGCEASTVEAYLGKQKNNGQRANIAFLQTNFPKDRKEFFGMATAGFKKLGIDSLSVGCRYLFYINTIIAYKVRYVWGPNLLATFRWDSLSYLIVNIGEKGVGKNENNKILCGDVSKQYGQLALDPRLVRDDTSQWRKYEMVAGSHYKIHLTGTLDHHFSAIETLVTALNDEVSVLQDFVR
eukprot:Nk52_evm1s1212 gene=Nk52_evmTU1s1212